MNKDIDKFVVIINITPSSVIKHKRCSQTLFLINTQSFFIFPDSPRSHPNTNSSDFLI